MKLQDYITYLPPMRRWRPNWTAQIGDLSQTGADREEANKHLFTHIKAAFQGSYNPVVIPWGKWLAHLWRDPDAGWLYSIKSITFSGPINTAYSVVGEYERTERYARSQLADFVYGDGEATPEEAAAIIQNEDDRGQFIAQCYRTRRVMQRMVESGLGWQEANEVEDGLRRAPQKVIVTSGIIDTGK